MSLIESMKVLKRINATSTAPKTPGAATTAPRTPEAAAAGSPALEGSGSEFGDEEKAAEAMRESLVLLPPQATVAPAAAAVALSEEGLIAELNKLVAQFTRERVTFAQRERISRNASWRIEALSRMDSHKGKNFADRFKESSQ